MRDVTTVLVFREHDERIKFLSRYRGSLRGSGGFAQVPAVAGARLGLRSPPGGAGRGAGAGARVARRRHGEAGDTRSRELDLASLEVHGRRSTTPYRRIRN